MKAIINCNHSHTTRIEGIEPPFLVAGQWGGQRPVLVDAIHYQSYDDDPPLTEDTRVVNGYGFYVKTDGTAAQRRTASHSTVRVRIADLPDDVKAAFLQAVRDGRH